jgi:hypothetical protein
MAKNEQLIKNRYSNKDERNWYNNLSAREKLFYLSLESLYELNKFVGIK